MATGIKRKTEASVKAKLVPAKAIATKVRSELKPKTKPQTQVQAKPKATSKPASVVPAKTITVAKPDVAAKPVAPKKSVAKKKPTVVKKAVADKKAAVIAKALKVELAPKEKHKKPKLVRDSFTMPEAEYALLGEVKKACIAAGIEVKKSQLLRIGLQLLKKTSIAGLKTMIADLPPLKAGRPKLN